MAVPGVLRVALLAALLLPVAHGLILDRRGAALQFAATTLGLQLAPPSPGYDLSNERIFDTKRTSFLPPKPDKFLKGVDSERLKVVCVGEVHTNPLHHRQEFLILKAMREYDRDAPLALGLEMFQRTHQPALDKYMVGGELAALKQDVQWANEWGFDLALYSKIFAYAKANDVQLVGLNCPRSLIQQVTKTGLSKAPPSVQKLLPVSMVLNDEDHRNAFISYITPFADAHGGLPPEAIDRLYDVQLTWEEYMSETAASYIKRHGGRMLVLAGTAHISGRRGIPMRIGRRLNVDPFCIVPQSVEWTPNGLPDIERPLTSDYADWVWYTQKELVKRST